MKKSALLLFVFLLAATHLFAQQNTILIIADDVSPDYFGSFSNSPDTAVAPNIRALAEKGVKFTKVWAAPVCSPTRAGIFTGRYPFRTGVGAVITNGASPQLDTAETSIAHLLKYDAPVKYNTACVGKWHLHNNAPPKRLFPNQMGYDFYSGNFNGALTDFYSYQIVVNGILDTVNIYATTQTVNDAINWLDTMNASKPFFLWLAFNAPHSPFHLPPANLCDTTGLPGTAADIAANPKKYFRAAIQAMDSEIGRLFNYLSANNLMDSTNIIFIGDNGNENQVAQIANPNKSKATIYDYGVHVPMIVKGPAVNGINRTSDKLVNTPDLFATMAELCGFTNWKSSIPVGTMIDSKSFLHLIKNQADTDRTWIFTEQFNTPAISADGKTIRNDDYHLLRFDNGNEEFYNQTIDVEENNNLLSGAMSATDISNYHFLCDTITTLTGVGTCLPLATNNLKSKNEVKIFPNPANSFINIECSQPIRNVTIISLLGEKIFTTANKKVELKNITPGIYFVQIFFEDGKVHNQKVVLE